MSLVPSDVRIPAAAMEFLLGGGEKNELLRAFVGQRAARLGLLHWNVKKGCWEEFREDWYTAYFRGDPSMWHFKCSVCHKEQVYTDQQFWSDAPREHRDRHIDELLSGKFLDAPP